MIEALALLIAAALVVNVVWIAASLAMFRLVGARAVEITLGPLPIAITRPVSGVKVQLTPWPTSSIRVLGRGPDDPDAGPRSWRRLGLARRLAAILAPWAAVFGVASATLGPAHAATSFAHGLRQILLVLDLTPLARALLHATTAAPLAVTLGVVCAKAAAANLVPWIGSGGAGVIAELGRSLGAEPSAKGVGRAWLGASVVLYLYVLGRLAYGFARAIAA